MSRHDGTNTPDGPRSAESNPEVTMSRIAPIDPHSPKYAQILALRKERWLKDTPRWRRGWGSWSYSTPKNLIGFYPNGAESPTVLFRRYPAKSRYRFARLLLGATVLVYLLMIAAMFGTSNAGIVGIGLATVMSIVGVLTIASSGLTAYLSKCCEQECIEGLVTLPTGNHTPAWEFARFTQEWRDVVLREQEGKHVPYSMPSSFVLQGRNAETYHTYLAIQRHYMAQVPGSSITVLKPGLFARRPAKRRRGLASHKQ